MCLEILKVGEAKQKELTISNSKHKYLEIKSNVNKSILRNEI